MKNKKELLVELREQNLQTRLAREVDYEYHKEILIPRYLKDKDKKVRMRKVADAKSKMKQIKVLISDLKALDKMFARRIEGLK